MAKRRRGPSQHAQLLPAAVEIEADAFVYQGRYYLLYQSDLLVYQRDLGDDRALVVVSLSAKKEHLTLPEELTPVLTAGSINLQGKELTLMPFAGVVLQKKK